MDLRNFAQEFIKQAGWMHAAKRIVGGLTGSTVKGIEANVLKAKNPGTAANFASLLPKAKAFQRNVRIGAGLAGGGIVAGRLSKSDNGE